MTEGNVNGLTQEKGMVLSPTKTARMFSYTIPIFLVMDTKLSPKAIRLLSSSLKATRVCELTT